MEKNTYIQPEITVEIISYENLLETLSRTDEGAGNGDGSDDYAKKGHTGFFFDDDVSDGNDE